jgi:hypothetical protein
LLADQLFYFQIVPDFKIEHKNVGLGEAAKLHTDILINGKDSTQGLIMEENDEPLDPEA